jgi:pyruvate/2-oxoacid:ferredoxin oxidoreductase alpha subunit
MTTGETVEAADDQAALSTLIGASWGGGGATLTTTSLR